MYQETTKALLRPHQVENLKEEARRLESSLQAPPHVQAAIQNPGEMRRQLQNTVGMLEEYSPKPYGDGERDAAIEREAKLRDEIVQGMPTQAEMRRNPAGAVDKHRAWEKRNKTKIQEWKNIRLRQHASGMTEDLEDAKDVANLERYRPSEASHELNMHNEQIAGRVQHGPFSLTPATVFTDEDKALLESVDPEIANGLAMMSNEQRAQVKAFIQNVIEPSVQKVQYHGDYVDLKAKTPNEGKWTEEQRRAHGEKVKAAIAAKKAKKEG